MPPSRAAPFLLLKYSFFFSRGLFGFPSLLGEFRASGREALCPRRQRAQNAAEPTVRTPFLVLCGDSLCERLPPNGCALPWQDWQNVILRLPALHVELPAILRQGVLHKSIFQRRASCFYIRAPLPWRFSEYSEGSSPQKLPLGLGPGRLPPSSPPAWRWPASASDGSPG